jgi:hypothetical protein
VTCQEFLYCAHRKPQFTSRNFRKWFTGSVQLSLLFKYNESVLCIHTSSTAGTDVCLFPHQQPFFPKWFSFAARFPDLEGSFEPLTQHTVAYRTLLSGDSVNSERFGKHFAVARQQVLNNATVGL